jgi:hypothetical protein
MLYMFLFKGRRLLATMVIILENNCSFSNVVEEVFEMFV